MKKDFDPDLYLELCAEVALTPVQLFQGCTNKGTAAVAK